jgi:hypothetical protein
MDKIDEAEIIISRIIVPKECDGVFSTKEAFHLLPEDIREHLATQDVPNEDAGEEDAVIFRSREALAVALMRRLVSHSPRELSYVVMACLRQMLKELSKKAR